MSADPDARLREAYGWRLHQRQPADRAACPSPEALLGLVERSGAEDARLRVFDHVMGCAPCRQDFDLLRTSAQAAVAAGGASTHWLRRPAARTLAIAASLVLVAGIATFLREPSGTARVTRGGAFALHESRRLPSGGTMLSWRPVGDSAVRYELTVLDDAGQSVVETRIADTVFVLPDSVAPGKTLVWSVAAVLPDGSMIGPQSKPVGDRK